MSSKNNSQCFTTTWKIENFSFYSSPECEALQFFPWKTETTRGTEWWQLHLNYTLPYVCFGLVNLKGRADHMRYYFGLSSSRGPLAVESMCDDEYIKCIKKSEIFDDSRPSISPHDTLTVTCTILHNTMLPGGYLFRTKLQKINFIWKVEGCVPGHVCRTLHQEGNILLKLEFTYRLLKKFYVVVAELQPSFSGWSSFLNCQLTIKGVQGRVTSDTPPPPYPCTRWIFNIDIDKNNTSNSIEFQLESLVAEHFEFQQKSSDNLGDDVLILLKEGLHSDVTLNSKEKTLFDGLQWQDAMNLYYATNKYAVHALELKRRCVEILRVDLTVSNACDALELADKLSDKELMGYIVDFIDEHSEVMSSKEWDKLEDCNSRLTSKIARELYLKKAKN